MTYTGLGVGAQHPIRFVCAMRKNISHLRDGVRCIPCHPRILVPREPTSHRDFLRMTPEAQTGLAQRRRVFFVDDHPLVREWLTGMVSLEPDLEVCGQAGEAAAALSAVPKARPE